MITDISMEVISECTLQLKIWGMQYHDPAIWLVILGEEVGEACKAVLESRYDVTKLREYRRELIQVAAVAMSAIECLDKKNSKASWEGEEGSCQNI